MTTCSFFEISVNIDNHGLMFAYSEQAIRGGNYRAFTCGFWAIFDCFPEFDEILPRNPAQAYQLDLVSSRGVSPWTQLPKLTPGHLTRSLRVLRIIPIWLVIQNQHYKTRLPIKNWWNLDENWVFSKMRFLTKKPKKATFWQISSANPRTPHVKVGYSERPWSQT